MFFPQDPVALPLSVRVLVKAADTIVLSCGIACPRVLGRDEAVPKLCDKLLGLW